MNIAESLLLYQFWYMGSHNFYVDTIYTLLGPYWYRKRYYYKFIVSNKIHVQKERKLRRYRQQ
jgi:hypothetical protein